MATKKSAAKRKRASTFFEKLSERASNVKDKLIEEKNHLAEVAGDTFEAVKEKIHDLRTKKPAAKKTKKRTTAVSNTVKKAAVRTPKAPKKTARKATSKAVKGSVGRPAKGKSK